MSLSSQSLTEQQQFAMVAERLDRGVNSLALELSDRQKESLIAYLFELRKWNRTYNLTALKTIEEMLVQHVFDCLAVIPALEQYENKQNLEFKVIADIGSGAGLPAVVLAIARPNSRVISIDAVQKKTSFVQNAANRLGLVNLEARHSRVEQVNDVKAELVISRAFASLSEFVRLAHPLVSPGGVMAAMKAKRLEAEIEDFSAGPYPWQVHQVDELKVPEMQAERSIAWLRRKNDE